MQDKITRETGVSIAMVITLIGAALWIDNKIDGLEIKTMQGLSDVRSEIVQYHTMLGTQQKQIDKIESLVESHQRDGRIHTMQ